MVTERNLLDSSSSDDGSLFDPIFGNSPKALEKTSSSRKKRKKPRNAASLKHARNDIAVATSSSCSAARPVRQRQDQDDHERVKEIASRKAGIAMLPEGITSSSQLVWYHDIESSAYYPCRICEPAEALHVRLDPSSWDPSEVALVQALDWNGIKPFDGRDRLLVNKSSLAPYHEQSSDTTKWSLSLWKRYEDQRRQQAQRAHKTLTTTDLETEALFLDRILQAAREREYDSEQERLSSDSSSSIASEDLEVPYSENLLPDDDFMDVFSDHQTEPLRPGDVVEYTHPIFVKGDRRGHREATVLSTDPDRNPVLVLSNGECLPSDTVVRRKQVLEHGQLYKHPHGFFRPIECFKITKRGEATVLDGMKEEGRRVGAIVDKNIAIVAKLGRANGFAPMDLFHKRSQSATVNENGGVLNCHAAELPRENGRKKSPPLMRPCAKRTIENRGMQRRHAASRDDESDSSVSHDVGIQTKRQDGRNKAASRPNGTVNDDASGDTALSPSDLRKLLAKKRVSMSSDSSLSSSDLQELSMSKRASVVTKKNGITTVNVDSDSDDSTGLQRTRPHNALYDGRTSSKQQSSALAIDADSDSDACFDSSAGGHERPGMAKKRFATSTGSDAPSPSPVGLSRPIRPRVISKSTKTRAKASSISPRGNDSDLQASRRWRLADGRQTTDAKKRPDATKGKSWEGSSDDENRLPGAVFSISRTKSRQSPSNVPIDRLEDSSSSDSMLRESSVRKIAFPRNNGTKSLENEKSLEAAVEFGSSREEKSSSRLFSPRDAGGHRIASVGSSGRKSEVSSGCTKPPRPPHGRDPDPLSFPSSDESSISQPRQDRHPRKKKSHGRTGVNVHGSSIRTAKSPRAYDREVDSSDSSVISFAPHPGRLGASKRSPLQGMTNGPRDESSKDRLEGVIHSVVASGIGEKSPAIDLTTNESDTSVTAENRLPWNHPVPLGSTLSVPKNAGWMKKVEKKLAATATARVAKPASLGLSFTKQNVRKARPGPPPKAVAMSLQQPSKPPASHTEGAAVDGKADRGTSCLSERDNFRSRDRVKRPAGGDDLIDSDDGMNTHTLRRKRLFQSSERGKAASLASVQGSPVAKRHKGTSNHYGSEQKPRSHFSKIYS